MKDEYGGKNLNEFVSLKSKIYAISNKSNNEKCINKGHNTFIEVNEFRNTLFQKKDLTHKMRGTKSKNHNIGTYETNKISKSCFDDKRYILENGIDTYAFRHKDK